MATLQNRNGWWHLNWMDGGRRHTRTLKTRVQVEAIAAKEELERRLRHGGDALASLARFGSVPAPRVQPINVDLLQRHAPRLFTNCRKNAAARGIRFEVDLEFVRWLITQSGGYCMVSGIPFDMEFTVGGRRPFAPSIDRLECDGHYCQENVQLVCVAVNQALHTWGPGVLYRLVEYLHPRLPKTL